MPVVRVLLADDDAMSRIGLRHVLGAEPDIDVAGEARNGLEAVAAARLLRPDVVVLDWTMPVLDGPAATRELVSIRPDTRVLVLTTGREAPADPLEPLWAGAAGLLRKDAVAERLAGAVRDVVAGGISIDPDLARSLVARLRVLQEPPSPLVLARLVTLTGREREVLARLRPPGASNKDIAETLGISALTVKAHIRRILAKLGLANRAEAARVAQAAAGYPDAEDAPRRQVG